MIFIPKTLFDYPRFIKKIAERGKKCITKTTKNTY